MFSWIFDALATRSDAATKRRVTKYARRLQIMTARNKLRAARKGK